ncbi:hypothetical protein QBC41DRAFT_382329 [Cercophora samala]|uniref:Uncharacterized protein n=1 Tax=Cercophora samala TaxID=330535 RepID=A0AA40D6B5_9PEZI|nr:hypothetical protein QBC41DRAFT_382329 [Cercophora samala]
MPHSYDPFPRKEHFVQPPQMLLAESAPAFVAVPPQQLSHFVPESMTVAQPAFTPAAVPSVMDELCFFFAGLTIQCAHTPMALIQQGSWGFLKRFGRPAFDLKPTALTLAPRLFGVPSLVKPTVAAPAVTNNEVTEFEIVRPAVQLPLPAGQLPLPPLAPIPVPVMAVSTPVAAPVNVVVPPAPVKEVRPQQAVVQPKRNRVVAPSNLVIQQLPQPELVVPKRRLAAPVNLVMVSPTPVETSPQQPLPRNTPVGPVNLVITPPTLASSSHPQQVQAPKQQEPAPAPTPAPPPIPSRPGWKFVKKLSPSEAQAQLTLPTLALPLPKPSVPQVTEVAPMPQPAPVVPAPVAPTVVEPLPPVVAPVIPDGDEQQAPIPPPGSRPLAPMRRRRAFGNTVPLPPDASDHDPELRDTVTKRRRPAPVVAAVAPPPAPVMEVEQPHPAESSIAQQAPALPPARTVFWTGLELRTLADRLIKECVDVDAWRRRLFSDIETYIGGEEDDDTPFEPDQASEVMKTLFRSIRSSDVGYQRQKDNTLNKVVRIARKDGLVIERL